MDNGGGKREEDKCCGLYIGDLLCWVELVRKGAWKGFGDWEFKCAVPPVAYQQVL
jgi:hypothetical protein